MSERRVKASISVDQALWRAFGAQLRLMGTDYSACLDTLVRQFLEGSVGNVPNLKDSGSFHPRNKRQHQLLEIILENTSFPVARQAIVESLRYFASGIAPQTLEAAEKCPAQNTRQPEE